MFDNLVGRKRSKTSDFLSKGWGEAYGLRTEPRAEEASGEGLESERKELHNIGIKREFDPGSESTLAARLTHASRARKWGNP